MGLMELTAEFVKNINSVIANADIKSKSVLVQIENLKIRIAEIQRKVEDAEAHINSKLATINKTDSIENDIIYVRKDGDIKAIISKNLMKPEICAVDKIEQKCFCLNSNLDNFESAQGYIKIETEEELFEADRSFVQVCLQVFDHDYRSFHGFSCYIAVYTLSGLLYIIDAIKFRKIIPKLNLLKCGVLKLIHCRKCVERLIADFGRIGCYRNFNVTDKDIFVDWRIRPFNDVFLGIIDDSMQEIVEKSNMNLTTENHEHEVRNEVVEFVEEHDLKIDCLFLPELLKLRAYLARTYDEGIQYVLTDKQLILLLENMPTTVAQFDKNFDRMSSVARLHAGDFLLILQKKAKEFSIANLKRSGDRIIADKNEEVLDRSSRQRSFDEKKEVVEDSSELIISSEE